MAAQKDDSTPKRIIAAPSGLVGKAIDAAEEALNDAYGVPADANMASKAASSAGRIGAAALKDSTAYTVLPNPVGAVIGTGRGIVEALSNPANHGVKGQVARERRALTCPTAKRLQGPKTQSR